MQSLYLRAIQHLTDLGFSQDHAESIVGMDLDSLSNREAHYQYVLECDAAEITAWIGVYPNT